MIAMSLVWMSTALAGGTIEMSNINADGLELSDVSCELDDLLPLGAFAVVAQLAQHKAAFDACGPDGQAVRARWVWTDTTAAESLAESKDGVGACVAKALGKVAPAMTGTCTATILTGPSDAARAAAAKLDGGTPAPAPEPEPAPTPEQGQ